MTRFDEAIRRIDEENSADPNQVDVDGTELPRELVYSTWLSGWVGRLAPDASEALRLAARCQHIARWRVPRESHPMDRAGYLRWREELKKFHAQKSGEILREAGYDEATIGKVQALNLKKNFPNDPESRVLEDALCLVFLERQYADIVLQHPEEKVIGILQKTWKKMSDPGREAALTLSLGKKEKAILEKALSQAVR